MKNAAFNILSSVTGGLNSDSQYIGRYRIVSTLKNDKHIKVFQAIYFKALWFRRCIIKALLINDQSLEASTAQRRLSWQFQIHRDLCVHLPIAKPIEEFELDGGHFLALEFLKGKTLQDSLDEIYGEDSYKALPTAKKARLIEWLLKATHIVRSIHELGYVHRDISASNFIVLKSELRLLDMEQVWPFTGNGNRHLSFPGWTKGYSSPQQIRNLVPTVKDDIYSLGCLIINVLTHVHPKTLNLKDRKSVVEILSRHMEYADGLDLVARCLDPDPKGRPDLRQMEAVLSDYHSLVKKN
jgi:serine/threonine protein kinase